MNALNLEKIKSRAGKMKRRELGFSPIQNAADVEWSGDQIIALVAEVERLNKIMPIGLIELNNNIQKLTVANKIMRDFISKVRYLGPDMVNECREEASNIMAEADEAMANG